MILYKGKNMDDYEIAAIAGATQGTKQWRVQDLWKGRAGNPKGIQMPRCRARHEKVAQRGRGGGGNPTHFYLRHLHYGVGIPSAYQTDLRGEKQKQKKQKQKIGRKGGGARPIRPPPPRIRHCKKWGGYHEWKSLTKRLPEKCSSTTPALKQVLLPGGVTAEGGRSKYWFSRPFSSPLHSMFKNVFSISSRTL